MLWAGAGAAEPAFLASGYETHRGQEFFLLSDGGFSSRDEAKVRVESERWAFEGYDGIDVVLYRVPKPLDFLKRQRDLHRVRVDGSYQGEGLSNTLDFLWDKWFKKSRMLFQQVFTSRARGAVTGNEPALKQAPPYTYAARLGNHPQYRVLKQFELIRRFRYPAHLARPIEPSGAALAGSSGNFLAPNPGNVHIPLGRLKPGLYLVEAYIGAHRAVTLVFVSDTVAITKISGQEMFVWTSNRFDGRPVADADLLWTDGNGVLKSDDSDDDGVAVLSRASPEKSYLLGQDPQGGVFASENFYYDSEIYNSKLYLFTDRPLYRPGDVVKFKAYGRRFTNARESTAIAAATVSLSLLDPFGEPLASAPLRLDPRSGGDGELPLPANAPPGGYELRFDYQDATYSAMFRVADYARPHFDLDIAFDRDRFHSGEPVGGRLRLSYPDGRPVAGAEVDLTLKSQTLSMAGGDELAGGRFPVKLGVERLKSDARGIVRFSLPAAAEPSRYILQAVASEMGMFPVSASRELLLQPAPPRYEIKAEAQGDRLDFRLRPLAAGAPAALRWETVRMEDRARREGAVADQRFAVEFKEPGSYQIFVRDARGQLLAQASHRVAAPAARPLPGSITIRADRPSYRPGETARLTLSFAEPVDDALVTLERDRVERHALLSEPQRWVKLRRLDPSTWQAELEIDEEYGPNITFSALYVKNGLYGFQNYGLEVAMPKIELEIRPDKPNYRPGERVNVEIAAQVGDKPAAGAALTAAVVDEMVYVLQPEVAPSIFDFFFHPRRDNVRTGASLDFYGYDLAWTPPAARTGRIDQRQRSDKLLTRPRRENIDTAAWLPNLRTDDEGRARFSFVMPDSLSRWRVTLRAVAEDGVVGQATQSLHSSQPVQLRWTGPTRYRSGDEPKVGLLIHSDRAREATLTLAGVAEDSRPLKLAAGANAVELPLKLERGGALELRLADGTQQLDRLEVALTVESAGWSGWQSRLVKSDAALELPADARHLRLTPQSQSQQLWGGLIDELIAYPYGCTEQTASRLIPLAIAFEAISDQSAARAARTRLAQQLQTARGRLMSLAGPDAVFTWWGGGEADPFLTIYAYYADWRASRALGLKLPPEHWQRLFDVYQKGAEGMPALQRLVALSLMEQMGLPVKTLFEGASAALADLPAGKTAAGENVGLVLGAPDSTEGRQLAWLVWRDLARKLAVTPDPALAAKAAAAEKSWRGRGDPVWTLLAEGLSARPNAARLNEALPQVGAAAPTLERALALVWLRPSLRGAAPPAWKPAGEWRAERGSAGTIWRYVGAGLPTQLAGVKPAAKPVPLRLSFESAEPEEASLPVTVSRTLYRLAPDGKRGFDAVKGAAELDGNTLYVDEVVLTPKAGRRVALGVIEIPLPPGAELESQRVGYRIDGLKALFDPPKEAPLTEEGDEMPTAFAVLGQQRAQVLERHYAVPVERLDGRLVVRHLLRFGQGGRFVVPPTRFYSMYAPTERAIEAAPRGHWTVK